MIALGVERASICGTSMGAGVALMLALQQPNKVERLILRSPPPFCEDLLPARRRMGSLATLCRYLGVPLTARIVGTFMGDEEQARTVAAQRRAALVPAIRGLLFESAPIPTERLSELDIPVLILGHPGGAMHPLRSAELICARIAGASLHVSPSAAHWKQDPDAFCRLVAAFVKDAAGSAQLAESAEHRACFGAHTG
jgi:pimeloyl-ACP methyl ester carboxylesterase